jgi:hypothetical protein
MLLVEVMVLELQVADREFLGRQGAGAGRLGGTGVFCDQKGGELDQKLHFRDGTVH